MTEITALTLNPVKPARGPLLRIWISALRRRSFRATARLSPADPILANIEVQAMADKRCQVSVVSNSESGAGLLCPVFAFRRTSVHKCRIAPRLPETILWYLR